jgi:poly-gamma-glutamate synthesis protein (capsule biosynthesis protein)
MKRLTSIAATLAMISITISAANVSGATAAPATAAPATAAPIAAPITSYAATPVPGVSIVMVGDILLHTPVEDAARDENGDYNFDFIFENTKSAISSADIAMVNQEVILGGEALGVSGYPAFNAPAEIGDALAGAGFDVICHATNHVLDKGKKGIVNTMDYWKTNHPEIKVVGINESRAQKDTVDIIEKNGIKIAVLNYTYGTNGISQPSDMPYAVDLLDKDKVKRDLTYAEDNADFTIVCPHWGTEYRLTPDSSQQMWTEIFREGGADLVIGTHPHVIEPIEFIEDDIPGHNNNHGGGDMLVYYSLGNFVNWTSGTGSGVANRMVGGLAQVTLRKDSSGEVSISIHSVTALVCHVTPGYQGVSVYPLSAYTDELGKANAIRNQDSSFSREKCVELCDQIWGKAWN